MSYGDSYDDRGMVKWAGFYLSEHTDLMNKDDKKRLTSPSQKPQMELDEINKIMEEARMKDKSVCIQMEARDLNGNYFPDVIGKIKGFDELGIYIEETKIGYDEIRHVCLYSHTKWQSSKEF